MGISKTYIPRLDLRLPAILFGLDSTAAFESGVARALSQAAHPLHCPHHHHLKLFGKRHTCL